MNSLLERPAIRSRAVPLTIEDYHLCGSTGRLKENVELLRGFIFEKMPKSPLHEYVAQVLRDWFIRNLLDGFVVRQDAPLTIGNSEPEPDISILPGKPSDWLERHPSTASLVVEISISTIESDQEKAGIYAEAGIPEYWIVRPEQREVDVHRDPLDGTYRNVTTHGEHDTLTAAALQGVALKAAEIFPPHK